MPPFDSSRRPTTAKVAYPVHQHVLGNGLRVLVSPDPSAPAVAVNLWYDVGSRDEAAGQTGWAHLFEHLMFQGSANVASGEHLQALQNAGGSANASTWFDRTNYFEMIPSGVLDLALWLEADRLATLPDALTAENVATQREVVKEEKRQRYDNVPYGDAIRQIIELVFPAGHPYAHPTIGSMADVDAATPDAAAAFFRKHYRPDNAVLTIVGDVTPDAAIKRVERYFGWIPASSGPKRAEQAPLPPLDGTPRADVAATVPANAVFCAWRLPIADTPEYDAVDLALCVLGDGRASRLFRDLVRDRGVVTSVVTSPLGLIGGNSVGLASALVAPGATPEQVEGHLFRHLDALADSGPTPDELRRALAQYERAWLTALASFDSRADQFSGYTVLHGDPELVNRRLEQVRQVSADDVRRACRDHLAPGACAIVTYHATQGGADE